jgi:sulfopyruvate decarboxylase subunit alpha
MTEPTRASAIADRLAAGGIRVTASLPDSWLTPLISEVTSRETFTHTRVTREDDAVAIAAGAALMGTRSAVLCQNAGALLATNMLAAFAHHHQLPFVVVAAERGRAEDGFYYQSYKGQVAYDVLTAAGLVVHRVEGPGDDWLIERASEQAMMHRKPVVLLCSKAALVGEAA